MVHDGGTGSRTFWLLFGFFLVFLGFLSIFTGIAQIVTAQDITFLIQIEDMFFVQETLTESSMIFSGLIRLILGFFFVVIGNSFMLRGGMHHHVCHPRMGDIHNRFDK